MLESVPDVMWK